MNPIEKEKPTRAPMTVIKLIPRTREQRRRMRRETTTIVKTLLPIDTLFNNVVLAGATEDREDISYEEIYKIFLNMWERALRSLRAKDLRIALPNVRYFADSYAPKIAKNA